MKIVVYGTGGVGGYYGARLEQAGNEVIFIARGKQLEAIRKNGLSLISEKGNYKVFPAQVTDDISDITNIDLILVCVKTWQMPEVAKKIAGVISDYTLVLPLLNGIRNADILLENMEAKHVLAGLCKVVSKIESPGVIRHMSSEPEIVFGELSGTKTEDALRIKNVFEEAEIKHRLSDNILRDLWIKFLYITTISGLGALTRMSVGVMRNDAYLREMMIKSARELCSLAKKKGIELPDDIIAEQFKVIDTQPYDTTASLQRDMMSGKPSELEAQNGDIVRLGKALNIPTPTHDFIYHCLLPMETVARKP